MKKEDLLIRLNEENLIKEWDLSNFEKKEIYNLNEKALWVCEKGHEWEAKIANRLYLKRGCPYCKGGKVCQENNLEIKRPDLLKTWNYKKNNISPRDILPASTKKVWWVCNDGHEWKASPHQLGNIKTKIGCPYCKGFLPSEKNSILDLPIMKEWDYEKNSIDPKNMTQGKGLKVHWKCKFGHEWKATIAARVRGTSCPFCKNKYSDMEIRVFSEIKAIYLDSIWHYKEGRKELDVFIPSIKIGIEIDGGYWHKNRIKNDKNKNIYFKNKGIEVLRIREFPLDKINNWDIKCNNFTHHKEIINKICYVLKTIDCKNNKLEKYMKENFFWNEKEYLKYRSSHLGCSTPLSETHPELIKEWNDQKNNAINPNNITYGSGRKVWWKCKKGHEWETSVKTRCSGSKCPYCSGKKVSKENNLLKRFPEIKTFWDYNKNDSTPESYLPFSHAIVWLKEEKTSKKTRIADFVRRFDV